MENEVWDLEKSFASVVSQCGKVSERRLSI